VDFQVQEINKKKLLQSQAGRLSRCKTLLKRLAGILIILGILFLVFKPHVYKKLGWELKSPETTAADPADDLKFDAPDTQEVPRHEGPGFRARLTPEDIERREKELLNEKMQVDDDGEYVYIERDEDYMDARDDL